MKTEARFDSELLRRYDRAGPRYTSYPATPQFTPAFTEARLRSIVSETARLSSPRTLSLYVHIPFCASPCFYCGCNRVITRDASRGERYVNRLITEIQRLGSLFGRCEVPQLHFGGGTPNFLTSSQLGRVADSLDRHFGLNTLAERDYSIELDPRAIDPTGVEELARLGFNRASLGVQDFEPPVQGAINRRQSIFQTMAVMEACRASGMACVNVDLIYGLPGQTPESFQRTLKTVIAARPDRLAVYGYAHMPHLFKAQRRIRLEDLPAPAVKLELLRVAVEMLGDGGYDYIGMDHFALPTDELARARQAGTLQRNFMGYSTHAGHDLLGLGVSAISHIRHAFSQNFRDLPAWEAAVDAGKLPVWRGLELLPDDIVRGAVIQQIMCRAEIDVREIETAHAIGFDDYFADSLPGLRELEADGLIRMHSNRIQVTPAGRYLLRIIAGCFDRYLPQHQADAPQRFSRVM